MPPMFCHLKEDEDSKHFGLFDGDDLVCVATVHCAGDGKGKLMKFATLPELQGKGIGSKLIYYILKYLKDLGIDTFWCDARTTATDFYEKLGMKIEGEPFYKYDKKILFCKMSMSI